MKIWPYNRFVIRTSLSPGEIEKRIAADLSAPEFFSAQRDRTYYRGAIGDGAFKIVRNSNTEIGFSKTQNAFRAVVTGVIHPENRGGATVVVSMRMNLLAILLVSAWSAALGSLLWVTISYSESGAAYSNPAAFFFPLFIASTWIGPLVGFWLDVDGQETYLRAMLERE